ncbi:MAG: carbohydrate kinase family protein [Pirellulaceae bacterium]
MTSNRPLCIGIGEVLWDLLPGGKQLGGAPANFGYHVHALGAEARVVSAVGDDPSGREILERLTSLGVSTELVATVSAPTGTVSVRLDSKRIPEFIIHEHVAWDAMTLSEAAQQWMGRADAVCFGTLAQRSETSRTTIRSLVKRVRPTALKVLDINLRQHYYSKNIIDASLRMANVLKINDEELMTVADLIEITGSPQDLMHELADLYQLSTVILTRGEEGSLLYREDAWFEHPGVPAQVVDTVGAGDAFTAATVLGLLAGWNLEEISTRANELAAYVCSQAGAMPPLPEELTAAFTEGWNEAHRKA